MQLLSLVFTIMLISTTAASALAQDTQPAPEPERQSIGVRIVSSFFDVTLLRPLGLGTTALGAGMFILMLPVAAISDDVAGTAKRMVGGPARYTFVRPIGRFD
ncbi:MAG TPA: hypothetical protein VEL28_12530 [Candidatus Binatia bacterium]|nr:hypothetical protein [Candidatus Binatia bacterium]